MNTVQQHSGKRFLTGAGMGAAAALYLGRFTWRAVVINKQNMRAVSGLR